MALAVAVGWTLSSPHPTCAQVAALGTVQGVVANEVGAVVAGAHVLLTSPALIGGPRAARTDQSGRFRLGGLPEGPYAISAAADGHASVQGALVDLTAGSTMTLDLVLHTASFHETVTVEAEPALVDVTRPSFITRIDTQALRNLPTDRSLAAQVNLAPGVTRSVGFGGTIGSNAVTVGSVDVTEPRTQVLLVPWPDLWTESVEVSALGADVEVGGLTGVSANASVRAGGNRLSGVAEWWTVGRSWVDRNVEDVSPREIDQWWDLSGGVGGPFVRDRLWFFGGLDVHRLQDRPAGFDGPGARSERTPRALVRLTAAAGAASRLQGFASYGRVQQELADVGPTIPSSVASDVRRRDLVWNLRADTMLGSGLMIEAGYGGYDSARSVSPHPPAARTGPSPRLDFGTFELTGNARRFSDANAQRHQLRSALTWAFGDRDQHELRTGMEFEWSNTLDATGIPGGSEYRDYFGRPLNAMFWAGESTTARGRRGSFWARDQWQISRSLTLTAGVRLDLNRGSVPERGVVLQTSPLAPRLGLVWDVGGRHRTAVKVHYGRYADALLLNPVAFLDVSGLTPQVFARPDASGKYVEFLRFTPDASNRRIDPTLSHSSVDQVVAGAEHAFGSNLVAQGIYVRRRFADFMAQVDTGSQWAPVTRVDPGPDGVFGTGDDGSTIQAFTLLNFGSESYVLTNPHGATRQYDAVQVVLTRRYRGGWHAQGSVTWAVTDGTIGNGDFTNAAVNDTGIFYGTSNPGVYLTPNGQVNARGRAPFTFSEAKVLASWRPPWLGGFLVSGVFRAYSGTRWERFVSYTDLGVPGAVTVRVEPRGARGLPAVRNLDLRVAKDFPLGDRLNLSVYADVLNVTNQGTPQFASGASGPTFGALGAYTDPRLLRAAARVTF